MDDDRLRELAGEGWQATVLIRGLFTFGGIQFVSLMTLTLMLAGRVQGDDLLFNLAIASALGLLVGSLFRYELVRELRRREAASEKLPDPPAS